MCRASSEALLYPSSCFTLTRLDCRPAETQRSPHHSGLHVCGLPTKAVSHPLSILSCSFTSVLSLSKNKPSTLYIFLDEPTPARFKPCRPRALSLTSAPPAASSAQSRTSGSYTRPFSSLSPLFPFSLFLLLVFVTRILLSSNPINIINSHLMISHTATMQQITHSVPQ